MIRTSILLVCISIIGLNAQINTESVLETAADAVPGGRVLTGVLGIGKKSPPATAPPQTVIVQQTPTAPTQQPLTDAGSQQTLHEIIGHLRQENNSLRQQVLDERQEKGDLKESLSNALEGAGVPHSALWSAILFAVLAVGGNIIQMRFGKKAKANFLDLFEDVSDALVDMMSSKNEGDQNKESVNARNEMKGEVVKTISKARKKANQIK